MNTFDEMIHFQNVDSYCHLPDQPIPLKPRKELHVILDLDRTRLFISNHGHIDDVIAALTNMFRERAHNALKNDTSEISSAIIELERALAKVKAAL